MYNATQEYDILYQQAQDFINNCDDKEKVMELLEILEQSDEQKQAHLLAIDNKQRKEEKELEAKPNQIEQQAHLGPGIVQSMKKYQNVKLQNFIETLYDQNVSVDRFAKEIEAYFFYHSIRKTKVI